MLNHKIHYSIDLKALKRYTILERSNFNFETLFALLIMCFRFQLSHETNLSCYVLDLYIKSSIKRYFQNCLIL